MNPSTIETDTTGFRPRKRKSTRRSSILKGAKSPTRSALEDLDANVISEKSNGQEFPKQRRISRRVSFAETHEVKEFLKDADAIGFWQNREQQDEGTSQKDGSTNQASGMLSDKEKQNFPVSNVQQHAPPIQGLQSLLSGAIKNHVPLTDLTEQQQPTHTTTSYSSATGVDSQQPQGSSHQREEPSHFDSYPSVQQSHPGHFDNRRVAHQQQQQAYTDRSQSAPNDAEDYDGGGGGGTKVDSSQFLKKFMSSGFTGGWRGKGQAVSQTDVAPQSRYPSSCDQTVHFDPECEGDMDMTACHSNSMELRMYQGRTETNISGKLSPPSNDEQTCMFTNGDDTGHMEFTTCVSGHNWQGNQTREEDQVVSKAKFIPQNDYLDKTVHFNRECDGDMEMTACHGVISGAMEIASATAQGRVSVDAGRKSLPFSTQTTGQGAVLGNTGTALQDRDRSSLPGAPTTEMVNGKNFLRRFSAGQAVPDRREAASSQPQRSLQVDLPDQQAQKDKFSDADVDSTVHFDNADMEETRVGFATDSADPDTEVSFRPVHKQGDGQSFGTMPTETESASDATERLDQTMELTMRTENFLIQSAFTGVLESTTAILHQLDEEIQRSCPDGENGGAQCHGTSDEKTRIFNSGEDTACMELTMQTGGILYQNSEAVDKKKQPKDISDDKTRTFSSGDDTARMELTAHTGKIIQQCHADAVADEKRSQEQNDEQTRVFTNGDDTGRMELTACVSTHDWQTEPTKSPGDSDGMDMTKCVTANIATFGGSLPSVYRKNDEADESERQDEKTRIFGSEDTAQMELTAHTGRISLYCHRSDYASSEKKQAKESDDDQTRMFAEDKDAGLMELTSCIGSHHSEGKNSASDGDAYRAKKVNLGRRLSQIPAADQTRVFNADDQTAAMDFTVCADSYLPSVVKSQRSLPSEDNKGSDEQTKVFGNSDDMEMTTHMTSNISLHGGALPGVRRKSTTFNSGQDESDSQDNKTRIFNAEDTAQMELTMPVGKTITFNQDQETPEERSTLPSVKSGASRGTMSDYTDAACGDHRQVEPEMHYQSKDSSPSEERTNDQPVAEEHRAQEQADEGQTASAEAEKPTVTDKSADGQTSKRDSDTFVLSQGSDDSGTFVISKKMKAATAGDEQTPVSQQSGLDDTFTVEPPQAAVEPPPKSQPATKVTSQISEEEDGIMEEKCVDFEDITDLEIHHHSDANKTLDSSKTILHLSSMSGADCSRINLSMSRLDDDLTNERKVLPTEGKINVSDFLEHFRIFLKNKEISRRSTLAPTCIRPLESLKDYLEIVCLVQPQHEMYEWAIAYLKEHTDKLLEKVSEQEKRLSENNPLLFDEIRKLPHEQLGKVHSKLKALVHACNKLAKLEWIQWKAKINGKILDALQEEHAGLTHQIASVIQSVETADEHLEQLKKVESELDLAMSSLELSQEFHDKVKTHKELSNEVKLRNKELDGLGENFEIMKKEQTSQANKKENLLKELKEIETTQEELANSSDTDTEMNAAFYKVKQLQRFLEWKLEDWNQYSAQYSFLESSLVLNLTFGKVHDNILVSGLSECDIVNVELESLLADDAGPCAKLAHRMVLGAVNRISLQQKYQTTKKLPMLLHHLSSVVCYVRQLVSEMEHIMFWHPVQIDNTCVSVEFSSLLAMCKFVVSFNLSPGQYPHSEVNHRFVNVIGKMSDETIASTLSSVKPGSMYLKRLVKSIELLLEKQSS